MRPILFSFEISAEAKLVFIETIAGQAEYKALRTDQTSGKGVCRFRRQALQQKVRLEKPARFRAAQRKRVLELLGQQNQLQPKEITVSSGKLSWSL